MKKIVAVAVSLAMLSIVIAGCGMGKGAADAAIGVAQTAFDATKEKAMQVAPDQAASVQAAIDSAKAAVAKGDYKTAMESAKAIPDQIKTMADGLAAKEQELKGQWTSMEGLAGMVDQFKGQVDKLGAMKHLPKDMDAAKLDAAKSTLATITQAWGEAQNAFQAGNIAEAVSKAGMVKSTLAQGMSAIGMALPDMLKSS